jgi:hypothetical protein
VNLDELVAQLPIDQLAAQLGADPEEVKRASRQSVDALVGGMQANAKDPGGAVSLTEALGQHAGDALGGLTDLSRVDTDDGDKIVGHVFGDQREAVVSQLGGTGDGGGGLFAKLLPMLAPLVMGWLAKSMSGGGGAQAPAGGAAADAGGGGIGDMLGGLLGGGSEAGGGGIGDMLGGLLGGSEGSSDVTDMLGGLLGGGRTG